MKSKHLLQTLLIIPLIFLSVKSFSQARSGIGIAYGPNRPYSGVYESGSGFQIMGSIKLSQKWAIVPNLGIESFNAKRVVFTSYDDPSYKRYEGVDLFYLGASAKYCFNNYLFAKGGPIIYAAGGNEDISGAGIGGNIAGGVNLNLDPHSSIEIAVFTTVVYIEKSVGNGVTPIGGLKFAYVFNFRGE